ncbi:MAG: hypothetical protein AAF458_18785 [Pseudomonadota bacterium]
MDHSTRFPSCYDTWADELPFDELLSHLPDPVGRLTRRLRERACVFGVGVLSEPERLYLRFDDFSAALADGSCYGFVESASAQTLADIETCLSMYDHDAPRGAFQALCRGVLAGTLTPVDSHAVYACVDPITYVQFELNAMMDCYAEQHGLFDAVVHRMPGEPMVLM